jgi:hypothetical protein
MPILINGVEQATHLIEGGAEDLVRDADGRPLPAWFGCVDPGASCFLVGRGPSATPARWQQLADSGVTVCAVNEYPDIPGVSPDLWVTIDPPPYFPRRCWTDPASFKFSRFDWRYVPLDQKPEQVCNPLVPGETMDIFGVCPPAPTTLRFEFDDTPAPYPYLPSECPRSMFFVGVTEPQHPALASLAWACPWVWDGLPHDSATRRPILNVLFTALRILYHLGFAKVYLLGFDGKGAERDERPGSAEAFAGQFAAVNRASRALRGMGHLSNSNFEVLQTSDAAMDGGLDAAEHVDFPRAVALASPKGRIIG